MQRTRGQNIDFGIAPHSSRVLELPLGTIRFWDYLRADGEKLLVLYPFLPSNDDLRAKTGDKLGETGCHPPTSG